MKVLMEPLLTYKEAAEYLGVSEVTLRRWVSQRAIGFSKIGSTSVRFQPRALRQFVESGSHNTENEERETEESSRRVIK